MKSFSFDVKIFSSVTPCIKVEEESYEKALSKVKNWILDNTEEKGISNTIIESGKVTKNHLLTFKDLKAHVFENPDQYDALDESSTLMVTIHPVGEGFSSDEDFIVLKFADEITQRLVKKKYNHAYDFNFEIISTDENATDVTPHMVRKALLGNFARLDDKQIMQAVNCFDTQKETD